MKPIFEFNDENPNFPLERRGSHIATRLPWRVVINSNWGSRCGYVGVPPTFLMHGCEYSDHVPKWVWEKTKDEPMDLNKTSLLGLFVAAFKMDGDDEQPEIGWDAVITVHGGMTFSDHYPSFNLPRVWWFGFDCAHAGDGQDPTLWNDEARKSFDHIREKVPGFGDWRKKDPVRTAEYVIGECERLAEQLVDWNSAAMEIAAETEE